MFDIPVVLFLFKRSDTAVRILKQLSQIQPRKLYLLSDEGRNETERAQVARCRSTVEEAIDWECEVIRHYAEENRGVYKNIGLGAKWVFEREKRAIFLEDDNLPELTFFPYCQELLERYEHDTRVLWICGTNYLGEYNPPDGSSYMFTKHLLPCGWASWADKYNACYDGEFVLAEEPNMLTELEHEYDDIALYRQQMNSIGSELHRKKNGQRFASWDYQMAFSIRAHSVYGISPCRNQIRNIGVDENSVHGGNSLNLIMTRRFCEIPIKPLEFPLVHPKTVMRCWDYEKKIGKIILLPLRLRVKGMLVRLVKCILGIDPHTPIREAFAKRKGEQS